MVSGTQTYLMAPGEVWVLNNSAPHAVWNAHETQSRTHMICDFLPSAALLQLLASGDRNLGRSVESVDRHFAQSMQVAPAAAR
jgi:hypothetical protein